MATKEVNSKTWTLADPGMDLLERAGLAGLYMALRAAKESETSLSPLEWVDDDLKEDSVTVRWQGPAKPAFEKLMEWAWQVKDNIFYFPEVHDERIQWWQREPMHSGLMKTYFQHPNVQPALPPVTKIVEIEEDRKVQVRFKIPGERVQDVERGINPKNKRLYDKTVPSSKVYPHRITEDKLFDPKGEWKSTPISLSNWIYPGVTSRFPAEESW